MIIHHAPDKKSPHDEIIHKAFHQVSALIRTSPPVDEEGNKIHVSDSVRLKLYGYYKVATTGGDGRGGLQDVHSTPRPSFFDPVGRAKYDAWLACSDECNGDVVEGMKRYTQVAASQDGSAVGKECAVIYHDMLASLQRLEDEHKNNAEAIDEDRESENGEKSITECCNKKIDGDAQVMIEEKEANQEPRNNTSRGPTISSWLSFLPTLLPRGQLDISILDLLYALFRCAQYMTYNLFLGGGIIHNCLSRILPSFFMTLLRIMLGPFHPRECGEWYEREIIKMTETNEASNTNRAAGENICTEVVVGLSIRSLLDLYLSVRSFPKGSEVVIVPGISIQGMVDVMEFHDLKLVPVDLPAIAKCDGNETVQRGELDEESNVDDSTHIVDTMQRELDFCAKVLWDIDLQMVKAAVSEKTVAILVVHPFGAQIADDVTMRKLRDLADDSGLEIWEDCAQCYTGTSFGSMLANASFFSFGPIKTSTALGGALAVLRNHAAADLTQQRHKLTPQSSNVMEYSESMKRIQETMYMQQSNFAFAIRTQKCLAVQLLSHSTIACGIVKILIELLGWDYDTFVVGALRGFSGGNNLSMECSLRRRELIKELRCQPSAAMLALLYRRLKASDETIRSSTARRNRFRSFEKRVDDDLQEKVFLPRRSEGSGMNGWIFPVLVENPLRTSKYLLDTGIDAPSGLTQLKPVMPDQCPRIRAVFDHILYLPVTGDNFSRNYQNRLVEVLKEGVVQTCRKSTKLKERPGIQQWRLSVCTMMFSVCAQWYFAGHCYNAPLTMILNASVRLAQWILLAIFCILVLLVILSQYMGPVYLQSSDTFSKYCDMLFQSPFDSVCLKETNKKFLQSKTVLTIDRIKIPEVGSSMKDDESPICLVTGATGFIGSLLLRELLLHRRSLGIAGVAVIVRAKRGKSAEERIKDLLSRSMFEFLSEVEKSTLVHVIEGDVTLPDCGLSQPQLASVYMLNISHVFHCAAAVSFSQSLEDAAVSNITSSLQMQRLTKNLQYKKAKFIYVSTAFVHGGNTGTSSEPLQERLFTLDPYDPLELYKSMIGAQSYASAAMNELEFPNTYTFSKCICEHLLHAEQSVDTIICRPSIVGPSVQEPYEGWAGDKPSTIVAAACLYLKFPYNIWCFGKEKLVPFVPVDVVCRFIISKAFENSNEPSIQRDDTPSFEGYIEEKKETYSHDTHVDFRWHPTITTIAWDSSSSESASFSWVSYAFAITHLGSVCGHIDRVVAYAGLLLSTKIFPWFGFPYTTFQRLHSLFVRAPIDTVLHLCQELNMKSRFARDIKVLSPILDLPMLFFPFANQNFYFKSDLVAPSDFNGERYMFSCAVAAHRFISILEKQRGRKHECKTNLKVCDENAMTSLVVAGSNHNKPASDLVWAITQPVGNLFIRFGGFVLTKIFRHTAYEIEIDIASFVELARMISESRDKHNVIIAPTHRSFYDFLIISFFCFSYPELGIEVPFIAAADDFRNVPVVGWLASGARAFFLKRGRKRADPGLRRDLDIITKKTRSHSFIEVFIEGTRSRYRTFSSPKTGFMRCLAETNQKFLVLPVTINYEALPDQTSLIEQACNDHFKRMRLTDLLHWLNRALSRNVSIGRVYVSASGVLEMPNGMTISSLCQEIQLRHQQRIIVSGFHVKAASLSLGVPEEFIFEALRDLHVKVWPRFSEMSNELSLQSLDLKWASMLHFGHFFAPFLLSSHPMWSSWLSPSGSNLTRSEHSSDAVKTVIAKLKEHFDTAEDAVQESVNTLQLNGFSNPDEQHIMQYLPESSKIPLFLMRAAIQIRFCSQNQYSKTCCQGDKSKCEMLEKSLVTQPLFHPSTRGSNPDEESLGAWGFQDSYFVLNVNPDGSKDVVMKGKRYSISGKKLPNLANFIEDELKVKIDPRGITFPAIDKLNIDAATALTMEELSEIAAVFGGGMSQVSTLPSDRARHGTGHTQEDMYSLRSGSRFRLPDVVVWPKSESEVSLLIALAASKNWCLIPFGGGTNVTHATRCPQRLHDPRPMISVDMKLMNQVVWVNQEDGLACVEAGITGRQLIEHVDKLGFTIGHEPDSYEFSTLGGWIATKASGMKQNRYGNIEDIVKEVTVVGANGVASNVHTVKKISFGRVSTGFDFKSIMLGSEGCLGIIVSAVMKIWPKAEVISHESVLLPDWDTGLRFAKAISKMRTMKPASVRLLDNDQFRLGQALKEESSRFDRLKKSISKQLAYCYGKFSDKAVVCATITFEGSFSEVQIQRQVVRDVAASHYGILAGPAVGKAGYDLTFAIAYLRDFALNYNILGESFETFVPWSKLKHAVQATKKRIRSEHRLRALPGVPFVCCRITQLYDEGACVYFYFCMNIDTIPDPSTTFSSIEECARQEILNGGGSLSHHHGLGKLRASFVRQIYSDGYVNSIIAIKNALDPNNIFGAGNGVFFQCHK